ncbi:hypothetical protein FRC04_005065 [Tulasnella sp. 424]|nr:hypothetical protein FRC04_005065 [Tulasnella sp. 424]KAG8962903.1 hypothetical protein FRC05_005073 [Tulasnella sp. 425]
MNAAPQNPLNAPVFEFPNPPDKVGQDGGKFYHCYDTLAQEIDDDLTSGLKEQLDGMLIFAGLFAGVNTAFLALTIPLLSADPADDTNALLAQNNALLMQLVMGRNDTVPADSPLPSTAFSPAHDIFIINALFALSLAFAIISSFLAVLGRQWLVYYRKRGGGGPDRQRWEQLKRFLGAERWRLEAILDDVLPSLLQIGLIIFCISLILYLRHLSPAISKIVGIPLYVGLAFFIGSALCAVWDRFCPFQSPLSHLLVRALYWAQTVMKLVISVWVFFTFGVSLGHWDWDDAWEIARTDFIHATLDRLKRKEENLELLQTIALQRAICISDDPATLIHATANILSIRSLDEMTRLWDDDAFQERFLQLVENPSNGTLQLRGYNGDPKDLAESSRRLYYSAAAHIALTLDSDWARTVDVDEGIVTAKAMKPAFFSLLRPVSNPDLTAILIPSPLLQDSSSNLIRGNLGLCIIWCSVRRWDRRAPEKDIDSVHMRNHLTTCSEALASSSDLRFLSLFARIVSRFPGCMRLDIFDVLDETRRPYIGNAADAMEPIREAFVNLLSSESAGSWDSLACDTMLTNMLRCAERIVADEQGNSDRFCEILDFQKRQDKWGEICG